jgi:hypothetical protein
VLLLVFLPGLIFNDSFGLDVHLFGIAINQCIIYAFPMVLAGTALTALVGYYVLPYDWSFNLAMVSIIMGLMYEYVEIASDLRILITNINTDIWKYSQNELRKWGLLLD